MAAAAAELDYSLLSDLLFSFVFCYCCLCASLKSCAAVLLAGDSGFGSVSKDYIEVRMPKQS